MNYLNFEFSKKSLDKLTDRKNKELGIVYLGTFSNHSSIWYPFGDNSRFIIYPEGLKRKKVDGAFGKRDIYTGPEATLLVNKPTKSDNYTAKLQAKNEKLLKDAYSTIIKAIR